MKKIVSWLKNEIYYRFFNPYTKLSYSQCGEDLIIKYLFDSLGVVNPTYLDVGAHKPMYLNNTYLFYSLGGQGVLVEPDITLADELSSVRKRDKVLNIGISEKSDDSANFYVMSDKTLNTFSKDEAERCISDGSYGKLSIEKVVKVELRDINTLLADNFEGNVDLLSVDIEGLDLDVIRSINFTKFQPGVICVESARCSSKNVVEKDTQIALHLEKNGYLLYADTFINSIFVKKEKWLSAYDKTY